MSAKICDNNVSSAYTKWLPSSGQGFELQRKTAISKQYGALPI